MKLNRIIIIQTKPDAESFAMRLHAKLGLGELIGQNYAQHHIRSSLSAIFDIVDVRPFLNALDCPLKVMRDTFLISDHSYSFALNNTERKHEIMRTMAHLIAWRKTRITGSPMSLYVEDTVNIDNVTPALLSIPTGFDVCFVDDSFPYEGKPEGLPQKVGWSQSTHSKKFCSAYYMTALSTVRLIEHFAPICCTLWEFAESCLNKSHLVNDYLHTQDAYSHSSIARRDIVFHSWHNAFKGQPMDEYIAKHAPVAVLPEIPVGVDPQEPPEEEPEE